MTILATSGNAYLVEIADGIARVLDLDQLTFYDPFNLNSIVLRGFWEPFTGSQDILAGLIQQTQRT